MTPRRSSAPVQTDPIRKRLGRPAVVRDVQCPNCGIIHATTHRWQMRCPECNHIWIDRSGRTVIDKLRDMRLQVFGTLWIAVALIVMLGGFAVMVAGLFVQAAENVGWDRTYGLAALFITCFLSLIGLGLLFRR